MHSGFDQICGALMRLLAMFGLLLVAVLAGPAAAETRALLAGVWQFGSPAIPDLKGPENDLAAMEALVRTAGSTDVTVLRNDQVTRTTMETALHALGLRSKPGDWIVLYYSGHGAQAEAAIKGTRDGDLDQFLPLAGFDPDAQDPERFIVDKDFYEWLSRYVPAGVKILMLADTCHSGTMNRSIDASAFHFTARVALRSYAAELKLIPRPAPRFPSVLAASRDIVGPVNREDLPNLVFIGAAQDGQLALESALPDEGAQSRGLLTYAFEQGLSRVTPSGRTRLADLDGDGHITASEIGVYLDGQVRSLSAQRQQPRTAYPASWGDEEILSDRVSLASVAPRPAPAVYAADPRAAAALNLASAPWRVVRQATEADFVWDFARRTVVRRTGDLVAEGVGSATGLRGVVEKWSAVALLRPLINEAHGKIEITPGGGTLRVAAGTKVGLGYSAAGSAGGFATIFNLAADGTVQLLFPSGRDDGVGRLDGTGHVPLFQNEAVAPFGADHIIAVVTVTDPVALRTRLKSLEGQRAPLQAVAPIVTLLGSSAGRSTLSVGELYTGN